MDMRDSPSERESERENEREKLMRERNCEPKTKPAGTTVFRRKGVRWRTRTKSAADQGLESQALKIKRCPRKGVFRTLKSEEQKASGGQMKTTSSSAFVRAFPAEPESPAATSLARGQ